MTKSIFFTLLMFSLFSCFRRKSPPTNIGDWLEQTFPGQFQVLDSNLKMLDIRAQFRGEKRALIAGKTESEVQFLLDWQKGEPSLGVDSVAVLRLYAASKADAIQAQALFRRVATQGLPNFSVGVIGSAAYIQVFAEPLPDTRRQVLTGILAALALEAPQTSIFVEWMEPAAYRTEFQDIIPRGHWSQDIGWQRQNNIMSINFEWKPGLKASVLLSHWALNPESTRCSEYRAEAYRQALAWAEKKLPQPYFMPADEPAGYEALETGADGPAIRYGFPYFDQALPENDSLEQPEPAGYVCGTFQSDSRTFSGIRKQAEF
ncbi:MAG: hypothetical protein IT260_16985 [Saprospiraceae bacterium]|nr:hypothetical protein [Saprospiraceae bacterium]